MDSINIITDTREQAPYHFNKYPVSVHRAGIGGNIEANRQADKRVLIQI